MDATQPAIGYIRLPPLLPRCCHFATHDPATAFFTAHRLMAPRKTMHPLAIWAALLCAVSAVYLEDAYVRDWTRHFAGEIGQFEFASARLVVAISLRGQLFGVNVTANSLLLWRQELGALHPRTGPSGPQFMLVPGIAAAAADAAADATATASVYTFSRELLNVGRWDSELGVLQQRYRVRSPPLTLVNFFNRGVLAVGTDGVVELLAAGGQSLEVFCITPKPSAASRISASSADGHVFLAVLCYNNEDRVFVVSASGALVREIAFDVSRITEMRDNLMLTMESATVRLLRLIGSEVRPVRAASGPLFFTEEEKVVLISGRYVVTYTRDAYRILDVDAELATAAAVAALPPLGDILSVQHVTATVNDYLVFATRHAHVVLDITGLLCDGDSASVLVVTFPQPNEDGDFSATIELGRDSLTLATLRRAWMLPRVCFHRHEADISGREVVVGSEVVAGGPDYRSQSGRYLIVDKPALDAETLDTANQILDDEQLHALLVGRWYRRVQRHVIELVEAAVGGERAASAPQFGLDKVVVFLDEAARKLVAVNTRDGSLAWAIAMVLDFGQFHEVVEFGDNVLVVSGRGVVSVSLRDGGVVDLYEVAGIERVVALESQVLAFGRDGQAWRLGLSAASRADAEGHYIDHEGHGFAVVDGRLTQTWRLPLGEHESAITVATTTVESRSGNPIGIAQADKSVLYKYLNPNIASVVSYDAAEETLTLHVVDVVTGAELHSQSHRHEAIDVGSVRVVMSGNWIVYTYLATRPRVEQRVVVLDLFETGVPNQHALPHNITIGHVSTKAFIFPERILELAHSVTKFGITTKVLLAFTDSGSVVQVPKFLVNSRRVADREFTAHDAPNDFRLTPYEPVLGVQASQVLNHKRQLSTSGGGQILSAATLLESTSVVCYFSDLDWFCTTIQPSLQYDTLGEGFAKTKLILTMVGLLLAVLVTKPMVNSKRLNAAWLDRS